MGAFLLWRRGFQRLLTKSYTYRHGPHVSVRRIVAYDLDAEAVVAVITGTALCGNCIARSTGIARWRVGDALQRLKAVVKIHSDTGSVAVASSASSFTGLADSP